MRFASTSVGHPDLISCPQVATWQRDCIQHPSQSIPSIDLVQIQGSVSQPYKMHLVPLSRNMLQRDEGLVNIPGSIPAHFPGGRRDSDAEGTTIWSATFTGQDYLSRKSMCLADATPFADLRIGVVLGSGSFAKVFYGTYQGQQVAVKVSPGPGSAGTACTAH